jgi:hypothetical protein
MEGLKRINGGRETWRRGYSNRKELTFIMRMM